MSEDKELYSTAGPVCPYCDRTHHTDGAQYYDESATELECEYCGKEYSVDIHHSTSWTTRQKDSPHVP